MRNLLLLHSRYDEDSQMVWGAAIRNGNYTTLRCGFSDYGIVQQVMANSHSVALYGGWEWGNHIAQAAGLSLASPPPDLLLSMEMEYPYLLRRRVFPCIGQELRNLTFPKFIKPADGSKHMTSRVYHSPDDLTGIVPLAPYLVSEVVTWRTEYRCFVLGGEVLTCSGYLGKDAIFVREATDFAATALDALIGLSGVPTAFVLDVGWIDGRGWAVVEANPAWCSGIYDCDPDAVLRVVEATCSPLTPT